MSSFAEIVALGKAEGVEVDGASVAFTLGFVAGQRAGKMAEAKEDYCPRWLPLESNPEMLNTFAKRMGMPAGFQYVDVWGLDAEILAMQPELQNPVLGVMLLYPSGKISKPRRAEWVKKVEEKGQTISDQTFFLYQLSQFGNACGTIAAVHALANNHVQGNLTLADGPLKSFVDDYKGKSPTDVGNALAKTKAIHEATEVVAAGGQTSTPDRDERVNAHFITFVKIDDCVVELDGCTKFPINHGKTTAATFLADVAKVVKEDFMKRDPDNVNFNVMVLVKTAGEGK